MGTRDAADAAGGGRPGPVGEWEDLLALGTVRRLDAGEYLTIEGDTADEVFVVIGGTLSAERRSDGGSIDLGRIGAGQIVGEITIIAGGRRTASLRATSPCEVAAIARDRFEHWLDEHPERADAVSKQARERLDRSQVAAMLTDLVGANDPALVVAVLDRVEWRRLAAGDVLFREGDAADAAYFVVNGRLVVSRHDDDGGGRDGSVRIAELGRGDIVGEIGLLDDAPRAATVVAARDSTLARFAATDFEELVRRSPPLMMHVTRAVLRTLKDGEAQRARRASTLAIAVVGALDADDLLSAVTDELGHFGSVRVLSSAGVDAVLNRPGISQADARTAGVPRLAEFLHEAEIGNDHLLFIADDLADAEVTSWTIRAVRQSDRVLVLAPADLTDADRAAIERLSRLVADASHVTTMLATVHPTSTLQPTDTPALRRSLGVDDVVHLRAGDVAGLARVARLAMGRGVGLVLSGGGARGFAHIGVYQALRAAGIPIDAVGGCSMGAPIAGAIASGVPDGEMVDEAERLFHRLLDYTVPVVSLLKGARIAAALDDAFGGWDIEDLWLPYYCVSTNLTTSALEVHRSGAVTTAVRASVSIPGVLPPVPFEGSLLVDGGVLDNLPVAAMVSDPRVWTVVAVDVAPSRGPRAKSDYGLAVSGTRALYETVTHRGREYPRVTSVLIRSMLAGAMQRQLSSSASRSVAHHFKLHLPGVGLLEFERAREVVEQARDTVDGDVAEFAATHPSLCRSAG